VGLPSKWSRFRQYFRVYQGTKYNETMRVTEKLLSTSLAIFNGKTKEEQEQITAMAADLTRRLKEAIVLFEGETSAAAGGPFVVAIALFSVLRAVAKNVETRAKLQARGVRSRV
jgi:hypothetical protein